MLQDLSFPNETGQDMEEKLSYILRLVNLAYDPDVSEVSLKDYRASILKIDKDIVKIKLGTIS